jgi:hypothetical protein
MAINTVAMSLMPISQVVSWYLVLNKPLYPSVASIASFFCLWALYNRYIQGQKELGQYSMGLAVLATCYKHRPFSMAATGLILVNFVVPAYFILYKWDAAELAKTVKKDTSSLAILWAKVFKAYFVSNICLWSTVFYKLYHNEGSPTYTQLPVYK